MTKQKIKTFGSIAVLALMSLILLWQNISNSAWRKTDVIRSDVATYYTYLPATFINNDPFFEDSLKSGHYRTHTSEIGRNAVKMSMGVAFMDLPFFFAGHLYALSCDKYEANGYSAPYHLAISLSSFFYTVLGMIFLWLVLKRTFSEITSLITVLLIAVGTNLYYYTVYETGYSHNITFFLLSALLFLVHYWLKQKRIWTSFVLGILLGLVVLVRPINILFILPLVIMFKNQELSWNSYFKQLILPWNHLLVLVLGGLLIVLPQLFFWKIQTGGFFSYSYGDEGFFFMNPHIWEGLFSFRKGWFIYTPLMFFALFGMFRLYKIQRMTFWAISAFLPLFWYVTYSWWSWWYGGSFGARTMIDILPFMAFPLASLVAWILQNKWRYTIFLVPIFFIYVNLYQSWQYSKKIIHFDSMTFESYKMIFLKDKVSMKYWKTLRMPDGKNARKYGVEKESLPLASDDPESPAYEKSVQSMMKYIRTNDEWIKSIEERAIKNNQPLDSLLRDAAIWAIDKGK